MKLTMEATHFLESRDRCHKEGLNAPHHGSHSLPGEPRIGVVSRNQMVLTTKATHQLEGQGQVS